MLLEIRHYLMQRQQASLQDLVLHFDTTPDAMRGMLDTWIKKGKVTKCDAIACGGCSSSCVTARQDEAYEWSEKVVTVDPLIFVKQ